MQRFLLGMIILSLLGWSSLVHSNGQNQDLSMTSLMRRTEDPKNNTYFIPIPISAQSRTYTCGVAALRSVLSYWGDHFFESTLQRLTASHKDNGTDFVAIKNFVLSLNEPRVLSKALNTRAFDEIVDTKVLLDMLADSDVQALLKRKANTTNSYNTLLRDTARYIAGGPNKGDPAHPLPAFVDSPVASNELDKGQPSNLNPYVVDIFMDQRPYIDSGKNLQGCPSRDQYISPNFNQTPLQKNGMTVPQLEQRIREKIPVIVMLQAWAYDVDLKAYDYRTSWGFGHYAVVVGYDEKNFYLMDPMNVGSYHYLARQDFLDRWHDYDSAMTAAGERCPGGLELHHFAMVIRKVGVSPFIDGRIAPLD